MYVQLNTWLMIFGIGFGLVCVLIMGIGYWIDRRHKKKQEEFWRQVALDDLRRRPDEGGE